MLRRALATGTPWLLLPLVAWTGGVTVGAADGREDPSAAPLEELARELTGVRRELAEIRALVAELREAVAEQGPRERREALERELEPSLVAGNGPEALGLEVALDGLADVEASSGSCGFVLLHAPGAESQVAVMEPAGILVGSLSAGGSLSVALHPRNVRGAFRIRAVAEVGDGPGGEVSFRGAGADPVWLRLRDRMTLETGGQANDGAGTLRIEVRAAAPTTIRLGPFEIVADGEVRPVRLPVSPLPVDAFPRPELPAMHPGIERTLVEWDWRMQDGIGTEREPRTYDQAIESTLERGDALLSHLAETGASLRQAASEWEDLREAWRRLRGACDGSEADREDLWRRVHALRRRIVLENPLARTGPIAFVKWVPTHNSIMQQQYIGRFARPGGGVFVLEDPGASMRCRPLTAGKMPPGAYQHLDVSYDGERALFSFCRLARPPRDAYRGNPGHHYDIWEIAADGSGLRPLVVSTHDDIAPRYLPDGGIAFVSTRRGGYSRCGPDFSPCHTLALADANGESQRLISFHEVHEYDPAVMNDGRLVYTRWDYVDREASLYQQLWATRPDGTNPVIFYGNNTFNPMATFEPRAIPGSRRIMAIAGCHHSIAAGSVVLLDVTKGVDGLAPVERLTPDVLFPETEAGRGEDLPEELDLPESRRWPHHTLKSPLPLSEDVFLASYSFEELVYAETEPNPANMFGLYLVDRFGNKELLYRDLNVSSAWAMPLRARRVPEPVPSQTDPEAPPEGTFYVQDVYEADPPLPEGVRIAALRIIHVFPRTSELETRPVIGVPVAACGRQVLGTVPVEADGSACFTAPAGVALAFQALDEAGQSVQFMRSVTYLQPGETSGCVGCHEHRMTAPPSGPVGMALRRAPSPIRPGPDGSKPFSYPRLVQPVLDEHCVRCHGGERTDGDVVLTGDRPGSPDGDEGPPFSASYLELARRVKYAQWGVASDEDFRVSNCEPLTRPDFFGARSSPLISLLRKGHEGVELDAEDLERIITWADNNALFYGTFDPEDQARQLRGERIEGPLVD